MTKVAKDISNFINRVTGWMIIVFFMIVIAAVTMQVFSRYIMNHSFGWTEEAARFAFIWLNMLGACICVKTCSHATITVLVDLLPPKVRRLTDILIQILILYVTFIMVTQGMKVFNVTKTQPSPALGIPMALIYGCVPVCGMLLAIHTIASLFELLHPEVRAK
jgi:TRAP-type C4-dicarboxylate transport system permease small subunit